MPSLQKMGMMLWNTHWRQGRTSRTNDSMSNGTAEEAPIPEAPDNVNDAKSCLTEEDLLSGRNLVGEKHRQVWKSQQLRTTPRSAAQVVCKDGWNLRVD